MSTASLSLLAKTLDQLDGNALDETAMGEWAASQIAEINKCQVPEEQIKRRLHVKGQIDAAIAAYGKGEKFFTPKAFEPAKPAATPLTAAKAKLAKQLEEVAGAEDPNAEKTGEGEGEGEDPKVEPETTTKARPARKAAPEHIGKDFVEADETDPWPDAIGGSMADVAIGPNGKVYNRVR